MGVGRLLGFRVRAKHLTVKSSWLIIKANGIPWSSLGVTTHPPSGITPLVEQQNTRRVSERAGGGGGWVKIG